MHQMQETRPANLLRLQMRRQLINDQQSMHMQRPIRRATKLMRALLLPSPIQRHRRLLLARLPIHSIRLQPSHPNLFLLRLFKIIHLRLIQPAWRFTQMHAFRQPQKASSSTRLRRFSSQRHRTLVRRKFLINQHQNLWKLQRANQPNSLLRLRSPYNRPCSCDRRSFSILY